MWGERQAEEQGVDWCSKGWSWAASREGQAQLDWRRCGHFRHGSRSSPLHWAGKPCTNHESPCSFLSCTLAHFFCHPTHTHKHTCRTAALLLIYVSREGRGVRYSHRTHGMKGWGLEYVNNWDFISVGVYLKAHRNHVNLNPRSLNSKPTVGLSFF